MKLPLMKPQNSQADDRIRATGPIGFCSSDPAFGIFFQNNKMLRLRSCAPTKCKSITTGICMMQLRNVQVPVLIHILKGRGNLWDGKEYDFKRLQPKGLESASHSPVPCVAG